jgi:hypothetical protein
MWTTAPGGELILADLCARCASRTDALFPSRAHGPSSVRLATSEAPRPSVLGRAGGVLARTIVYVLIALAVFFLVTLVSAR